MELGWTALAFIIIAAAVAWFWQDSLAARERANAAAIEACERLGLQFLDGTVAFARIALSRGDRESIALRRTYVFDYTANSIERRQGFVLLSGQRIESVGYAPVESQRQVSIAAPPQRAADREQPPDRANVFSLEDWRARQRVTPAPGPGNNQSHGQNPPPPSAPASWHHDSSAQRPSDHSDRKH
jgi:hypothetical protein